VHLSGRSTQWFASLAIFAAIMLVLVIAAILSDPFTANIH
jgi:hypothetical protein